MATPRKPKDQLLKVGRKTTYKPEYCQQLIDHMADGFSFESFAANVDTCRATIYEWRDSHPEFADAFYEGNQKRLKSDEEILKKMLAGKIIGGSARLLEFKMRCCHKWVDKTEVVNTNIETSYEDYIKQLEGQK